MKKDRDSDKVKNRVEFTEILVEEEDVVEASKPTATKSTVKKSAPKKATAETKKTTAKKAPATTSAKKIKKVKKPKPNQIEKQKAKQQKAKAKVEKALAKSQAKKAKKSKAKPLSDDGKISQKQARKSLLKRKDLKAPKVKEERNVKLAFKEFPAKMVKEVSKIRWSTKQNLLIKFIQVILFILVFAILFYFVDLGWKELFEVIKVIN